MIVSCFYLQPEYNGGSLQPTQVQGAGTLGKVGPSPGQDSAHGCTYRVAPRGPRLPPALSAFQVRVSGGGGMRRGSAFAPSSNIMGNFHPSKENIQRHPASVNKKINQ